MVGFKLLVDTNIVIALEDPRPVEAPLAELIRLCNEHSVRIFVDGAIVSVTSFGGAPSSEPNLEEGLN
jgi:hypothetical protein